MLLPALALISVLELTLRRSGELVGTFEVAREVTLEGPPALALRMILSQETPSYRLAQIELRRPRFLVLGSSRVQRFRREMFCASPHLDSFYNSSGTITGVEDLEEFLGALPSDYAPEILLIGLDSWWLNDSTPAGSGRPLELDMSRDRGLTLDSRLFAYGELLRAMASSRLTARDAWRVLSGHDDGTRRFGLLSWVSRGFTNDGSLRPITRTTPDDYFDRERPPVVDRVRNGTLQFLPTESIDARRLERLATALDRLARRGTAIVGWLPPFSLEVEAAIDDVPNQRSYYRAYLGAVKELFRRRQWLLLDATSPARFGLDDRAMEDGFHAMETLHVAALAELGREPGVSASLGLSLTCLTGSLGGDATSWYADFDTSCDCSVE